VQETAVLDGECVSTDVGLDLRLQLVAQLERLCLDGPRWGQMQWRKLGL